MLDLRPNCECCDRDLPPEAADARIVLEAALAANAPQAAHPVLEWLDSSGFEDPRLRALAGRLRAARLRSPTPQPRHRSSRFWRRARAAR